VTHDQITEVDIERMKEGFALFNAGNFDALREFVSPDVQIARTGNLPPLRGWDAFRAMQEPDAFEWQKIEPLDWTVNGDKVLLHVSIRSKGAMSGMVLEQDGWMVWTVADHLVVRIEAFTTEADATPAAGLASRSESAT
jgi:ketosteroid isomerase-like protein